MPDLSIIVVTYNSAKDIGPCLDSIHATREDLDVEVFVVDNASKDCTVEIVGTEYPWARLLANDFNAGFPAGNNQAILLAAGRYVMLLNPDTVVLPEALRKIVAFMDAHAECGVCGPSLIGADGRLAPHLRPPTLLLKLIDTMRLVWLLRKQLPADAVEILSGACLVLRRDLVDEVGLLDEDLFWCEDVDYCRRVAEHGYRVRLVPDARVIHIVGQSARSNPGLKIENMYVSEIRYLCKHMSSVELRLVLLVNVVQVMLRWMLWRIRGFLGSPEQAAPRVRALKSLLPRMVRMLLSRKCSPDALAASSATIDGGPSATTDPGEVKTA